MHNNQKENALIEQLKEIVLHSNFPPVTQKELAQAEAQLGFELPSFLRRLYLEVGNGGFGPDVLPLIDQDHPSTDSLVASYLGMRSLSQEDIDTNWVDEKEKPSLWPERALILCDWGCNIYSCLDCSSPELPVLRMDSNINFLIEWAVEASSLQQWLEAWLDGRPLFYVDWEQASKVSVSYLYKTHRSFIKNDPSSLS